MKKRTLRIALSLSVLFLLSLLSTPAVLAAETGDEAVQEVIAQLQAIDTLQEMQNRRSEYPVSTRYDVGGTDAAIIAEHTAARTGYETYVSNMFAARLAARQAYGALSPEQQAQIDPALRAKLSDELPTVFHYFTGTVTPRHDEYSFETVNAAFGLAYEVSHHMIYGNIPQTFVLVDTSNGETDWTPSGKYVPGASNYDVTYCCDVETGLHYGIDYKRMNLEDAGYYSAAAAGKIRAVLQNSYPFVTLEEMKASLKAGGLDADFVDSLSRSDIIAAVQMAVWTYANSGSISGGYFSSVDITRNSGIYFTPLHDTNNECWDWLPGKRMRSYDARAEYRVNTLAYYLSNLPAAAAPADQILVSDVEITRAELIQGSEDSYRLGLYIYLNSGGTEADDLTVTATSYHSLADGGVSISSQNAQVLGGRSQVEMWIQAKVGDTIAVVVEGTQELARGVYFYEPEGGRSVSQCLVGVGSGKTHVRTQKSFTFEPDIDAGLRIYKTETDTPLPIEGICFDIYTAAPEADDDLTAPPTAEDIAKYAVPENLQGSITTDSTGYAALALSEGRYLVIEQPAPDKVLAPVDPFYITLPMPVEVENEAGETVIRYLDIVSVYPKNTPYVPPLPPPPTPPPPHNVSGSFSILKHDAIDPAIVLGEAQFKVWRPAGLEDTVIDILLCDGISYAVVPVQVDGKDLILTTDVYGRAFSPELPCGPYFLQEIQPPRGFLPLDSAVSLTVVPGVVAEAPLIDIPNERNGILPETGGIGTAPVILAGTVMALGALALLLRKQRRSP